MKRYLRSKLSRLIGLSIKTIIEEHLKFHLHCNVSVGENVSIADGCSLENCKIGNNIKIGRDSYLYNVIYGDFSYNSIRSTFINCEIGKFCSIAQGVSMGLGKHPSDKFISTHPIFYSINKQCGYTFADQQYFDEMGLVSIGNDVWIGANSIILDDIKIGDGAIIAANSLVNKDVPPYAIVGGSPAKHIRYRFSPEQINFLLNFKWWDKELEWIEKNFRLFHDLDEFIYKLQK